MSLYAVYIEPFLDAGENFENALESLPLAYFRLVYSALVARCKCAHSLAVAIRPRPCHNRRMNVRVIITKHQIYRLPEDGPVIAMPEPEGVV